MKIRGDNLPVRPFAADLISRLTRALQVLGQFRASETVSVQLAPPTVADASLTLADLDQPPFRTNGQAFVSYARAPAAAGTYGGYILSLPSAAQGFAVLDYVRVDHTGGNGGRFGIAETLQLADQTAAGCTNEKAALEQAIIPSGNGTLNIVRPRSYQQMPPMVTFISNLLAAAFVGGTGTTAQYQPIGDFVGGITELSQAYGLMLQPGMAFVIGCDTPNQLLGIEIRYRFFFLSNQPGATQ